jgi:hypothetical protein
MGIVLVGLQAAVIAGEPGFRTDRLPAGQRKVWKAIEKIVRAQDQDARPLHPRLYGLWQKAATGKHEVHIELDSPMFLTSYAAGHFEIENCPPEKEQCSVVIRLCLPVIEKATLAAVGRLTDEFMPFKGLSKEERYVEVLGHELTHALCALEDPNYASMLKDLDRQSRELTHYLRQKGGISPQEKQERIGKLRSLANEIERPAERAEAEIWQELRDSQPVRIAAMR